MRQKEASEDRCILLQILRWLRAYIVPEKDPAQQLPVDASATKPSSATAQVTEHTKTDVNGNTVSQTGSGTTSSSSATAKQSPSTGDTSKDADQSSDSQTTEKGKEFYTIQTASEKIFYLVIDRDGEDEKVYFLTEVSENDLLNTTTDNSETLPKIQRHWNLQSLQKTAHYQTIMLIPQEIKHREQKVLRTAPKIARKIK